MPLLRSRLSCDASGLRLAVLSDTHARPHPRLLGQLRLLRPQAILHAGDVGALSVLDALLEVAPVYPVRGNVDAHAAGLPEGRGIELAGPFGSLRLLLVHHALRGPRLRGEVVKEARREDAALVVCGHSHLPFIGVDQGLTVFNPGSAGPRRFSLPIVFGVLDFDASGVRLKHVDCETGEDWLPPR